MENPHVLEMPGYDVPLSNPGLPSRLRRFWGLWHWKAVQIWLCFVLALLGFQASVSAQKIAAGSSHSLAVSDHGTVWAWGSNSSGQLGDDTLLEKTEPIIISALNPAESVRVIQVAAGLGSSYALKSDGTVWAWGNNVSGKLGLGTTTNERVPVRIATLFGIVRISASRTHVVALKSDGTVWAWGSNISGQLGDGTTTNRTSPVQVSQITGGITSAITGAVDIAAGTHTLILKSDGTIWSCGSNSSGQLGDGTTTGKLRATLMTGIPEVAEIAAGGGSSFAIGTNGIVYAWGSNGFGQLGDGTTTDRLSPVEIPNLSGTSALVCGPFSLALKQDGTVWSWGRGNNTELGDGTRNPRLFPAKVEDLEPVTEIAAGDFHVLASATDGRIFTWGLSTQGQLGIGIGSGNVSRNLPVPVSTPQQVTKISVTGFHVAALTENGSVLTWGNGASNLGTGTTMSWAGMSLVPNLGGVISVANGVFHSLAVKGSDGTVQAWCRNSNGQLGDGTATEAFLPVQVALLSGVEEVAAGSSHSLALKSDGTVWAWGNNSFGQLGNGTFQPSLTRVRVSGLDDIIAITAGDNHSVALRSDGTIWCWGRNDVGQLGDGTVINSGAPVQVFGLSASAVSIAAGVRHTLVACSDGSVWSWGSNDGVQLGNSESHVPVQVPGISEVVKVAAGSAHSVALKSDGTVWSWGSNSSGELGAGPNPPFGVRVQVLNFPGEPLEGVASISAGESVSAAIREDGTLVMWGSSGSNKLGINVASNTLGPVLVPGVSLSYIPQVTSFADHPGIPVTVPLDASYFLSVTSTGGSESISRVALYHERVKLEEVFNGNPSFEWTPTTWGRFTITAQSVDSAGVASKFAVPIVFDVPYDSEGGSGDGLPDWWEMRFLGSLGSAGTDDSDNDGFTNLQEFQNGTDPGDFYNGVRPVLSKESGDLQQGVPGTVLGTPLVIRVTGAGGPLSNAPVEFQVTNTNALLSTAADGSNAQATLALRTNGSGEANAYVVLPTNVSTTVSIQVNAGPPNDLATVSFSASTNGSPIRIYKYDAIGRLTEVLQTGQARVVIVPDPNGNILSVSVGAP
jgi:alpha-tubulin suppressor-like RCC1 family protein